MTEYLPEHDTEGLTIEILPPDAATAFSLERIRRGEDTISVTGNVLRDYLTDLFPILELGTSAKMLSIVPAARGRRAVRDRRRRLGARSTSSSSSKENYLRWDSLGEFLALVAEFRAVRRDDRQPPRADSRRHARPGDRHLPRARTSRRPASSAASTTAAATTTWPSTGPRSSPRRRDDAALAEAFLPVATALVENEETIVAELLAVQGEPVDLGGYYLPDQAMVTAVMRPSRTLNAIVDGIGPG